MSNNNPWKTNPSLIIKKNRIVTLGPNSLLSLSRSNLSALTNQSNVELNLQDLETNTKPQSNPTSPLKKSDFSSNEDFSATLLMEEIKGDENQSTVIEDPKMVLDFKVAKVLSSKKEADRSEWTMRIRKLNPDIAEIQDRITPIGRSLVFGETYIPKRDEIQSSLSKNTVTQLILQHLQSEGLKSSRIELEHSSSQKLNSGFIDMQESKLVNILRVAMREVERIWDLTMPDKYVDDEELEEHLYELGLLEEDPESSEDMNIWEEPEEDNLIWYIPPNMTKQAIKAGTLNKLVEQLTSEKEHDMEFQRAFLITYQSFTTPEKLLQKLMQRYQVPEKKATGVSEQEFKSTTNTIQLRVVNVLKKWLGNHWGDLNEQQMENFKTFLDKHIKGTNEKLYIQLQSVLQRKNQDERKQLVFNEPPPEPKVSIATIFSTTLSLFDLDDVEVARQLTIMEFDLFSRIKPYELLNQAWNKPKLRHRAQNVLALINRSTEISAWVASCIVKETKLRNRARVMTRIIKIAEQLRKLNNFSTLMAIMAGLNNAAVFRLKFTREEIPKQYQQLYEFLMTQVNSANGYKVYREILSNVQPPCIPYLGIYLTDLTFMDDGSPNFLPSPKEGKDLINFAKRRVIAGVITQVQTFQLSGYNLQPVHQILMLVKTEKMKQQKLDEKEIWKLSQIEEPRDADKTSLD